MARIVSYMITFLIMQEAERAVAAEEGVVGGELPSLSADDLQKLKTAFKYSPCFQHFLILIDFTL